MKIGFIGCGNMAGAIIEGLLSSGMKKEDIMASDVLASAREKAQNRFGIKTFDDNEHIFSMADVIVIAVKPQYMDAALGGCDTSGASGKLVISIAAGKKTEYIMRFFDNDTRIVRAMPNTPALAGCGMTGFCGNRNVTCEDMEKVRFILESFGEAEEVPESLMDAVTSVSGSSPAFIFMMIEALADGAVLEGMPRDKAYKFAAQTVKGSAELVLKTGMHPGQLKDMVCSPSGTTIEGVRTLENASFRGIVMEAVHEAAEKSRNM
ncbi:MAG: pyrroline-5-carboxylate reductase [Lachnospiraceae bacterium]|jgi:pyrroline-5-carboxylate reductase